MTSLPTRLHPRTDETFYGYVARLSHSLSVPTGLVLRELGLLPGERIGWGCLLRERELLDVADALTLPPDRVEQLTLRRYRHLIQMPSQRQWRSLGGWASTQSVLLRGGRFCPDCLRQDSTWRLAWRLPEQIGCRTHHRLLQDQCDRCQGPASAGSAARAEAGYLDYLHHPRFCYSQNRTQAVAAGLHAPPCGRDLSRIQPQPLSDFQDRLSSLVARIHLGQPVTLAGRLYSGSDARQVLREAMTLQAHAERSHDCPATHGARLYRRVLSDAQEFSRLLSGCADWLFCVDPDRTVHLLATWMDHSTTGTPSWSHFRDQLPADPAIRPQLSEALQRFGRPSSQANRLRTPRSLPSEQYRQALPQLAWNCALPPPLRSSRSPHFRYIQAVMSLQLTRRNTVTWDQAAAALGLPHGVQWKRNVYTKLGRQGQLRDFLANATMLHRRLLRAPGWDVSNLPGGGSDMNGLTEGLCRSDGAAWCPCAETQTAVRRQEPESQGHRASTQTEGAPGWFGPPARMARQP